MSLCPCCSQQTITFLKLKIYKGFQIRLTSYGFGPSGSWTSTAKPNVLKPISPLAIAVVTGRDTVTFDPIRGLVGGRIGVGLSRDTSTSVMINCASRLRKAFAWTGTSKRWTEVPSRNTVVLLPADSKTSKWREWGNKAQDKTVFIS